MENQVLIEFLINKLNTILAVLTTIQIAFIIAIVIIIKRFKELQNIVQQLVDKYANKNSKG